MQEKRDKSGALLFFENNNKLKLLEKEINILKKKIEYLEKKLKENGGTDVNSKN